MPRSLSSRLLLAFAFVIVLSLAISAVGTLFLLRDQQEEAAEERVGRLAQPITLGVALLERAGADQDAIEIAVRNYAQSFDVRILLVTEAGTVVADTRGQLIGEPVEVFREPGLDIITRGNAQFRKSGYDAGGDKLVLFAPPEQSLKLPADRLLELQATIFGLLASGVPQEQLDNLLTGLQSGPDTPQTIPLPELRPLVAVPEKELASAWRDLLPQLALAAGIALIASAAAAFLISRSVSGRLARVTRAAQEMALGNYDQRLDLRGQDEVGRLAQAFNVMARQVSRSHRMMRDLLANVSHELKTPLTSIQGFSQALEEGAISTPEDQAQAARIINEETLRMRRLVDDLIELSRLESGQIVLASERVDLPDLLRACAERFEWQVRESNTELRLDVESLPTIRGDERRLEQVFSNLIDNAVRHTPRGGSVTVRGEARNGAVSVAVHNTGSYISPDELARVFERFFQVDPSRSRGRGGVGLGLAIANEVVQAHHGSIRAESDRATGTAFFVTLPISPKRAAPGMRPS
jgi:signal transduction histidine kinase